MQEDELVESIEKAFRRMGSPGRSKKLRIGMGDDAALLTPLPEHETILTCDWFLEGMHFLRERHPAEAVGWKCLARATSDIAAMGGAPRCFLLSLALPPSCAGRWLDGFLSGLRRAARRLGLELAGGDTSRHRQILVSITVIGEVRRGEAVLRSGARPGDLIWVSGRLGEAQLGMELLPGRWTQVPGIRRLLRKHLYPEPRIELGQWLSKRRLATAMIDVSDGLSTDLGHLCEASDAGARVYADKLPLPRVPDLGSGRRFDLLALALDGGDDYELLFTVPWRLAHLVPREYRGVSLTKIGEITRAKGMLLVEDGNRTRPIVPRGWDPFRR